MTGTIYDRQLAFVDDIGITCPSLNTLKEAFESLVEAVTDMCLELVRVMRMGKRTLSLLSYQSLD